MDAALRPDLACSPANFIRGDRPDDPPEEGVGLCLSGGGYRAMLFHLGAIVRLNEFGLLGRLGRVSSVSGGSITAALLGCKWGSLGWRAPTGAERGPVATRLDEEVCRPLRRFAGRNVDVGAILRGLLRIDRAANVVARAYDRELFRGATLQDLPDERAKGLASQPRFILNATNLRTGVLWRFSRPYMADYTVGRINHPTTPLALAVAASSAFPPLLSPLVLPLKGEAFAPDDPKETPINAHARDEAVLTDGGVYDNLGMETVWKNLRTVFMSDAGGGAELWDPRARRNWLRQFWRVFWVQRQQVGGLRRRLLMASYRPLHTPGLRPDDAAWRHGAFWSITTPIEKYGLPDAQRIPEERARLLRETPIRLARMAPRTQEELIALGYALCDASVRRWYDPTLPAPGPGRA